MTMKLPFIILEQGMEELFTEMNSSRKEKMKYATGFLKEEIMSYETRFDILLSKGYEENTQTKGKYAKESEKTLLNWLTKYKSNHLMFIMDFNVPTIITFQSET